MDCIHARLLIVLQDRDAGELDVPARAGLDQHLEQCADCLAWSLQESRVDAAIGQAIQAVPVPAGLPSRILHHLEHQRRPRRWPWVSAAAACLLLGLSLGGYVWYGNKPELTADYLETYVTSQEITTARDVEERFAEMGMPIEAPAADFNFDYYNGSSIVQMKGYRIPRLEFVVRDDGAGQPNVAHVYVVDKSRFDVHEIEKVVGPVVTSKHRIEILVPPPEAFSNFIYIAVYTGANLTAFRPKPGPI